MLIQNYVQYSAAAAGYTVNVTLSSILDFSAGNYPIFGPGVMAKDVALGDVDTFPYASTIKPNAGESYSDFQTRLNNWLTSLYNSMFGVGGWSGGLILSISDDGTDVSGVFEALTLPNGFVGTSTTGIVPLTRVYTSIILHFKVSAMLPGEMQHLLSFFGAINNATYQESVNINCNNTTMNR